MHRVTDIEVTVLVSNFLEQKGYKKAFKALNKEARSLFNKVKVDKEDVRCLHTILDEYLGLKEDDNKTKALIKTQPALADVLAVIHRHAGVVSAHSDAGRGQNGSPATDNYGIPGQQEQQKHLGSPAAADATVKKAASDTNQRPTADVDAQVASPLPSIQAVTAIAAGRSPSEVPDMSQLPGRSVSTAGDSISYGADPTAGAAASKNLPAAKRDTAPEQVTCGLDVAATTTLASLSTSNNQTQPEQREQQQQQQLGKRKRGTEGSCTGAHLPGNSSTVAPSSAQRDLTWQQESQWQASPGTCSEVQELGAAQQDVPSVANLRSAVSSASEDAAAQVVQAQAAAAPGATSIRSVRTSTKTAACAHSQAEQVASLVKAAGLPRVDVPSSENAPLPHRSPQLPTGCHGTRAQVQAAWPLGLLNQHEQPAVPAIADQQSAAPVHQMQHDSGQQERSSRLGQQQWGRTPATEQRMHTGSPHLLQERHAALDERSKQVLIELANSSLLARPYGAVFEHDTCFDLEDQDGLADCPDILRSEAPKVAGSFNVQTTDRQDIDIGGGHAGPWSPELLDRGNIDTSRTACSPGSVEAGWPAVQQTLVNSATGSSVPSRRQVLQELDVQELYDAHLDQTLVEELLDSLTYANY